MEIMDNIKVFIKNINIKRIIEIIFTVSYIYVAWIAVHYLSSHLYTIWCVPPTIMGFLTAPFLVPAPHCTALRWAITTGGQQIIAMWTIIGTSLFNLVINYTTKSKND